MMLQKITDLLNEISSLTVTGPEELETFRLKYLSKKGIISDFLMTSGMYQFQKKKK